MARTELTKTDAPGPYGTSGVALTKAGADTSNQNSFRASNNDLVIAHNTDSVAHSVTITSVQDPYNRTGDISSESIAAGEIRIFGPFRAQGWQQPDGHIYLEADDATVELGVVKL